MALDLLLHVLVLHHVMQFRNFYLVFLSVSQCQGIAPCYATLELIDLLEISQTWLTWPEIVSSRDPPDLKIEGTLFTYSELVGAPDCDVLPWCTLPHPNTLLPFSLSLSPGSWRSAPCPAPLGRSRTQGPWSWGRPCPSPSPSCSRSRSSQEDPRRASWSSVGDQWPV